MPTRKKTTARERQKKADARIENAVAKMQREVARFTPFADHILDIITGKFDVTTLSLDERAALLHDIRNKHESAAEVATLVSRVYERVEQALSVPEPVKQPASESKKAWKRV